jgi:hypothetical protein
LQKLDRVRKLYKRFFPVSWTFSITRFSTFFRKTEFFNSHACYRQLTRVALGTYPAVGAYFPSRSFELGWDCDGLEGTLRSAELCALTAKPN